MTRITLIEKTKINFILKHLVKICAIRVKEKFIISLIGY